MNNTANINVIIRLRVNSDGDGVRTVVFFYGCPLQCVWCCNPETRFGEKYTTIDTDDLYDLISRDLIYFNATDGGVTFSGGEPLLYADFIKKFLDEHKCIKANIETSLYCPFEKIERLSSQVNEWYIDFKLFIGDKHKEFTGVFNDLIKSNITKLTKLIDRDKIILTFPVIPNVNDSDDNIEQMITFMKSCGLNKVELHPYRKNSETKYQRLGLEHHPFLELSPIKLSHIRKMFLDNGIIVQERRSIIERNKCDVLKEIRRTYCKENNIKLKEVTITTIYTPETQAKGTNAIVGLKIMFRMLKEVLFE